MPNQKYVIKLEEIENYSPQQLELNVEEKDINDVSFVIFQEKSSLNLIGTL